MGKFDNRNRGPGESHESDCNVGLSGKDCIKKTKLSMSVPYFSDPLLIPRINQYVAENRDKVYIDINDMVTSLQSRHREYARRKRNVFRQAVQKAYNVILQQSALTAGMTDQANKFDDEYVSTDQSSSDVEECNSAENEEKKNSSSNSQLMNLYKPVRIQTTITKAPDKSTSENAELIDLSSDEENVKKKDGEEENFVGNESSNSNSKKNSNNTIYSNNHNYNHMNNVNTTINNNNKNNSNSRGKAQRGMENNRINRKECLTPDPHKLSNRTGETHEKYGSARKRKLNSHVDKKGWKKRKDIFQEAKVSFADFAGNAKTLEEVCKLILHIRHPEFYRQIGVSSPRGFLLHGPPGCGKTLLAAAIAGELDVTFLKISAPELVGGVSGESEERIRELFESAVESSPCVLFIDEIDAITPNRQNAQREMERRIVAQLLTCLDELSSTEDGDQVLVIGATNRPDSLDPALRRAGRFDKEVCLGIPDVKAREQILKVVCKNLKMAGNFPYEKIATNTPGFVGADLVALAREAAMAAVNRVFEAIQNQCSGEGVKRKRTKMDTSGGNHVGNDKSDGGSNICKDSSESGKNNGDANSKKGNCDSECNDKPTVENSTTENKKEEDISRLINKTSEKQDTEMDIDETASENSVNLDVRDIDICKVGSVKAADTEDENEMETIPESCQSGPPNVDKLLSWLRDIPPLTVDQLEKVYLTEDDFNWALRCVQPSAKREGFATVPDVTWDDVGSLADVREELKMCILGPVKMRKQFEQLGLTSPSGILICGPPGCGKTLLAKAVANEAGINFISVKGPELLNMYVGESERAVRQCFQRARNSAPCVIFFDELDALCPKRSNSGENGASMRVVNQMLTEMDGIEDRKEVFLMAATNRPDIVDPAVLRPGRLDKVLYVGLPEAKDRTDILRALTKNGTRPKLAGNVNLEDIARRPECNGYSGADLAALVREAGVQALKDVIAKTESGAFDFEVAISLEHFEKSLKIIRPSVSAQDRKHYETLREKYCASL